MVPRLRETRPPRPEEARMRESRNLGTILWPIPVEEEIKWHEAISLSSLVQFVAGLCPARRLQRPRRRRRRVPAPLQRLRERLKQSDSGLVR